MKAINYGPDGSIILGIIDDENTENIGGKIITTGLQGGGIMQGNSWLSGCSHRTKFIHVIFCMIIFKSGLPILIIIPTLRVTILMILYKDMIIIGSDSIT